MINWFVFKRQVFKTYKTVGKILQRSNILSLNCSLDDFAPQVNNGRLPHTQSSFRYISKLATNISKLQLIWTLFELCSLLLFHGAHLARNFVLRHIIYRLKNVNHFAERKYIKPSFQIPNDAGKENCFSSLRKQFLGMKVVLWVIFESFPCARVSLQSRWTSFYLLHKQIIRENKKILKSKMKKVHSKTNMQEHALGKPYLWYGWYRIQWHVEECSVALPCN
jgi:hypothetical protein